MGKGRRERARATILKAITALAGIIFMLSAFAVDSDSWIPFIICMASGAWLGFMALANR